MAHIQGSVVTLRVAGDEVIPQEITKLLGCEPTASQIKGQIVHRPSLNRDITMKIGSWRMKSTTCEPEDINKQVSEILGKLTNDLSIWQSIASKFEIDLFCGLFMERTNEGAIISASTLQALGERRISLSLDVYAPIPDLKNEDPCPCDSGISYGECCGKDSTSCDTNAPA